MRITADFEGGNVTDAAVLAPDHVRVCARADRSPQPLWFYFAIEGATRPSVRVDLANADACLGPWEGWLDARPVFSGDGVHWQRVARTHYLHEEDGPGAFSFTVPVVGSRTYAAYCFPYTPSDLRAFLDGLDAPQLRRESLCRTAEGRDVPLVRVGPERAPAVWIVARQHAGETPGSFVVEGLLRHLTRPGYGTPLAWRIVPMLDVDGAFHGRYGKDEAPIDMNRDWANVCSRPETIALRAAMAGEPPSALLLDLHSPHHGDTRCYFFGLADDAPDALRERESLLLRRIAAECPAAIGLRDTDVVRRPAPQASLRDWALREHGALAICLETSYHLAQSGRCLNPSDYRRLGEAVARGIAATLTVDPVA